MPARRTRRLTSGAATGLVVFALFGGFAAAMAADRGPGMVEAYAGVNGFDPRALNKSEMDRQVSEAVANFLAEITDAAQSAPPREQINVVLTLAHWDPAKHEVQAAGFAPVVEQGGTCTLRLTGQSGEIVEARVSALPDATTTSCAALRLPATSLTPGTWQAVLGYESATVIGASQPMDVVIP